MPTGQTDRLTDAASVKDMTRTVLCTGVGEYCSEGEMHVSASGEGPLQLEPPESQTDEAPIKKEAKKPSEVVVRPISPPVCIGPYIVGPVSVPRSVV